MVIMVSSQTKPAMTLIYKFAINRIHTLSVWSIIIITLILSYVWFITSVLFCLCSISGLFSHSCLRNWPFRCCVSKLIIVKSHPTTVHQGPRGGVEVQLHSFSTSALGRGGWSAPRPGRFTPAKDPVPIVQEIGWAPGPVWTCAKNLDPTGIRSPYRPARSHINYKEQLLPLVHLTTGAIVFQHLIYVSNQL
jgi:hypothetical protein